MSGQKERALMSQSINLACLDATAQADLVLRKEIKHIDLIESAIERVKPLNPTLNAVVTPI